MRRSGVRSVMLARGALIKPWLFREIREGRTLAADARGALRRAVALRGAAARALRRRTSAARSGRLRFLPWHLNFFCRYVPAARGGVRGAGAAAPAAAVAPAGPARGFAARAPAGRRAARDAPATRRGAARFGFPGGIPGAGGDAGRALAGGGRGLGARGRAVRGGRLIDGAVAIFEAQPRAASRPRVNGSLRTCRPFSR